MCVRNQSSGPCHAFATLVLCETAHTACDDAGIQIKSLKVTPEHLQRCRVVPQHKWACTYLRECALRISQRQPVPCCFVVMRRDTGEEPMVTRLCLELS